ncbi:probable receptor-like protein kinase At2g23200 [Prosopis cineraria]|uniref:probable receptor-like protein kinase At2g23200 n=1 Tax=Prosopis cineraria TaxID=364024 RepID=UPI00241086AF|nr:probable receptor-like protein kinase At2g23200 [Prosopis cineraria]
MSRDSSERFIFENEILFTCQLHYPNLVSLLGFCDDEFKDKMMVVYDYLLNGSLHHQLHFTKGIAIHRHSRGRQALESQTNRFRPFFKRTKIFIQGKGQGGTLGCIDPAYLQSCKISSKCDVFGFGMLLVVLICRESLHTILRMLVDEYASQSFKSMAESVRSLEEKGNIGKIIDPSLVGEIAPECWRLYMDIATSCTRIDPDESPDMGEVEVQLERALQLQREADAHHNFHAFLI